MYQTKYQTEIYRTLSLILERFVYCRKSKSRKVPILQQLFIKVLNGRSSEDVRSIVEFLYYYLDVEMDKYVFDENKQKSLNSELKQLGL